jgi:hypothetical protein
MPEPVRAASAPRRRIFAIGNQVVIASGRDDAEAQLGVAPGHVPVWDITEGLIVLARLFPANVAELRGRVAAATELIEGLEAQAVLDRVAIQTLGEQVDELRSGLIARNQGNNP